MFNIAFSIAVKLVFLVLAIFGYASLWLAIAADTGATLIVTQDPNWLPRQFTHFSGQSARTPQNEIFCVARCQAYSLFAEFSERFSCRFE